MSSISTNLAGAVARRGASTAFRVSSRSGIAFSRHAARYTQGSGNISTQTHCLQRKISAISIGYIHSRQQQQCRKYSSKDGLQLKQVGFEDINTKLTTTPSSTPSNITLVDVREPAELAATGIIPGAVSIPLASQPDAYFLPPDEFQTRFGYPKPGFVEEAEDSNKDSGKEQKKREIIFYCRAGVRAEAAAKLAVQAGYDPSTLSVYYGSWLDWADKGGKVEKWEGNE